MLNQGLQISQVKTASNCRKFISPQKEWTPRNQCKIGTHISDFQHCYFWQCAIEILDQTLPTLTKWKTQATLPLRSNSQKEHWHGYFGGS